MTDSDKLDQILSKLNEHDAGFDRHEARVDTITAKLNEHDARFESIEAKLSDHDTRFNGMVAALNKHDARLDEMLTRQEFAAFKDELFTTLDGMTVILQRLDQERHMTQARLDRHEEEIKNLKQVLTPR